MIKFFRNIRHQFMNEGKTSKYLKYAVGEIVLVVIGILIAIQINNWNNARLNKISELNFYLNFKEQMVEDIHEIEDNVEYNNNYINQFKQAVQIIEKNDRSMASVEEEVEFYEDKIKAFKDVAISNQIKYGSTSNDQYFKLFRFEKRNQATKIVNADIKTNPNKT